MAMPINAFGWTANERHFFHKCEAMTKRRIHAEPRSRWTKAEDRLLRAKYPHMQTAKLLPLLPGRTITTIYQHAMKLGLHKTAAYLASADACRLRRGGNVGSAHRFHSGQTPWNKGTHWTAGGRSALTRFKKGQRSARWPIEDYSIGALRINTDGQLDIKVKEGLRAWYSMARWVWMTERGPIPKNGVIRTLNGDQHDTRIENLRLTTRGELMRENTYHRYPKEIGRLIQLRGALQRQINKRENRDGDNA